MNILQCFYASLIVSSLLISGCATKGHVKNPNAMMQSGSDNAVQTQGLGDEQDLNASSSKGSSNGLMQESGSWRARHQAQAVYYFAFNDDTVSASDRKKIEQLGHWLNQDTRKKVILEGHTDPRGSREYNIALGERRAKSVANILKDMGVSDAQYSVVSYGAEHLASSEPNESGYALDRRVEVVDHHVGQNETPAS